MLIQNFLYQREYAINKCITVMIPTVGQVLSDENGYQSAVSAFTAMPIDVIGQLHKIGIDFTTISDFDLFLILFRGLTKENAGLVLKDIDPSLFEIGVNPQNGQKFLKDRVHDITIDRSTYARIAAVLRKINNIEKNTRKPANEDAKEYMIERAVKKLERQKHRKQESELESLIVALVNTEQFKYDFEGIKELSIYQFNESVRQVMKKIDYDNKMHGIYAGTLNPKDLGKNDLNWLNNK